MILHIIPELLTTVFLRASANDGFFLLINALYIFGMWGIFVKCGVRGWLALIPCMREAKLGEITGWEREGRIAATLTGISILLDSAMVIAPSLASTDTLSVIFMMIQTITGIARWIYTIRLYRSLIEVFDRKRRWILLWATVNFIPALLWGWRKKYQPLWKVDEMRNEAAEFFSGSKAVVLDQGLTVNLEERTANDFFKKKYLLRDIHMYIQPGHMVLLLGGSGAGKTTYINAVNGYEKAKAEIVLNGRNMYKNYKEMQYDIGFVPQLDLMRGSDSVYRCAIMISHRLTNIQNADRIYVMDEGKIVEIGSHKELMMINGLYADMYHKQTANLS